MEQLGLNDWLSKSVPSRKRTRLARKGSRRGKKHPKRKEFTPDELIDYLRVNGFKTVSAIRAGRSSSDRDPTDWEYRKEFGSFKAAVKIAFPSEIFSFDPENEEEVAKLILSAVVQYQIKTVVQYEKMCAENPKIIPNMYLVRKIFIRWSNLMELRAMQDLAPIVERYKKLRKKKGRFPSIREAEAQKVYIRRAIDLISGGSKKRFDRWITGQDNGKAR